MLENPQGVALLSICIIYLFFIKFLKFKRFWKAKNKAIQGKSRQIKANQGKSRQIKANQEGG